MKKVDLPAIIDRKNIITRGATSKELASAGDEKIKEILPEIWRNFSTSKAIPEEMNLVNEILPTEFTYGGTIDLQGKALLNSQGRNVVKPNESRAKTSGD